MALIRTVETFHLRIPRTDTITASRFQEAPGVGSIYPTADELLLVRIATDNAEGWGEVLAPASPEAPEALIRHVFAPMLLGVDIRAGVRPVTARLQSSGRERGHLYGIQADAVAGIDMALWDLLGHELGAPAHLLLGGARRERVPVYLTEIAGIDTDRGLDAIASAHARGITRFKVHVAKSPSTTLATYDAVRAELQPTDQLALDSHWCHDASSARQLAHELTARDGWFFEAPMAPEDVLSHRDLARLSMVPIAVGEAMRSRYEFGLWSDLDALNIAQPDVARTGVTEAVVISELMARRGVGVALHHSMCSAVAWAAGLQVMAVCERPLALEYGPRIAERSRGFMEVSFVAVDSRDAGSAEVPQGPGIGVRVDLERVRNLASGTRWK